MLSSLAYRFRAVATTLLPSAVFLLGASLGAPPAAAQAPAEIADLIHVVQPGETLYRIATRNNLTVEQLQNLNRLEETEIQVGQRLRLSAMVPMDRLSADALGDEPGGEGEGEEVFEQVSPSLEQETAPVDVRAAVSASTDTTGTDPTEIDPTEAEEARTYVVKSGDTLFRIALDFDTTVEALRRLNDIEGDRIAIGQRLRVQPGSQSTAEEGDLGAPRRAWSITDTTIPADQAHFVEPGETVYSIAAHTGFSVDALLRTNRLTTAPLEPGQLIVLPEPRRVRLDAGGVSDLPVMEAGLALVYPAVMQDRPTASGEAYDPLALTASHRTLPFGTVLVVTHPETGRSTFVRVNDRGPVSQAYAIELSSAAATALGLNPDVAQRVEIRRLP